MFFLLKKIITAFVVPPMSFLWLALLGMIFIKKFPRLARTLVTLCLIMLFLLGTPFVSSRFMCALQSKDVLTNFKTDAQAMVVLGGGVYYDAPEYGGKTNLKGAALERIKYAAYLFDKTGSPILVSGGDPYKSGTAEGNVMKAVLEGEFMTPVTWVEIESKDTYENAEFSYKILSKEGKTKILLVTNASHMPRSKWIFEKMGFQVIPAPTIIDSAASLSFQNLLPNTYFLQMSYDAFHEWIGRLWYQTSHNIHN